MRAARPVDPPQTRPVRPTCRRVQAKGIFFRSKPCGDGQVRYWNGYAAMRRRAHAGVPSAILDTGRGADPRPPASCWRPAARQPRPRLPWVPPSGALLRVRGVDGRRLSARQGGLPTVASRFDGVNRPSDATWKQRLGLITLAASVGRRRQGLRFRGAQRLLGVPFGSAQPK